MAQEINLENLKRRIPFKWRVQSFSKNKPLATLVAYIDSRDVQNLLDEVCGAENWQSDYKGVNNNMFCGIGIKINNEWVWKWDCGTETQVEKEKGEASDSFKRAAVKWGVGRFLYDMDIQYVDANEKKTSTNFPYCVDKQGKKIYDITEYINKLNKEPKDKNTYSKPAEKKQPEKKAEPEPEPVNLGILQQELLSCLTMEDLKLLSDTYIDNIRTDVDVKGMFTKRRKELQPEEVGNVPGLLGKDKKEVLKIEEKYMDVPDRGDGEPIH